MIPFDQPWLAQHADWTTAFKNLSAIADRSALWSALVAISNTRADFLRTNRLDRQLQQHFGQEPPPNLETRPVRLAVLGSSTISHLLPAIRIAALRRGLWVSVYEAEYGQYLQELRDENSALHKFQPNTVLFAQDARHMAGPAQTAVDPSQGPTLTQEVLERMRECWQIAQKAFHCPVVQQTLLPVFPALLGNNEHRLVGSQSWRVAAVNAALHQAADESGVDILAMDQRIAQDGLNAWYNPMLWHRAKQEISPAASPMYGDMVARILAARQGRSSKCLVLDLDNTLWGGVIGDDGLEGIVLGQGSALGEAFVDLQMYALELAKRGVILAVCSKNDEANALAAFDKHPEMVLRRSNIACFVANWTDKASNLRHIAQQLNIGIDSLVFVDDNPFERNLVRQELPMVAVPEVPDDPGLIATCLADAGYFEALAITAEDRERTSQYRANADRDTLRAQSTDMASYLNDLDMKLIWSPFDRVGLQRTVQLINKTNQFNLTTRRYTEDDVLAVMADPLALGLQLRLTDKFGNNGIIAIVIGKITGDEPFALLVDTWLMSCRVLGRHVEQATLNLLAQEARRLGAHRLLGEYRPSAKNNMVKEHYQKLGFTVIEHQDDGTTMTSLDLTGFKSFETPILTLKDESP